MTSGDGRERDRARAARAGPVVARLVVLGPPAQLRGRRGAGPRRQPVDRAHTAGDRDVGAAGRRLRLPGARARLQAALRAGGGRLEGRRQAAVRSVQVRPHEPRLLHLGPLGGRGLVLRGGVEAGGPDRRGHGARQGAGQAARALDRPLRRPHAVHQPGDAPPRCRLRVGSGDGGDHADRLQPDGGRRTAARRRLPVRGHVLLRQPAHHAPGSVGDARAQGGGRRVRALSRPRDHAGGGGRRGLPPGGRDARPRPVM